MARFVMVINEATSEEFEKIISIQVKSGDKLRFVPQIVPLPQNVAGAVGTNRLQSQTVGTRQNSSIRTFVSSGALMLSDLRGRCSTCLLGKKRRLRGQLDLT